MPFVPGIRGLADGPMLPPGRHPLRRQCRRVFGRLVILLLVGAVIALAHRLILVGLARLFRIDEPVASDAIVLLLEGADHRPAKAADLFRRHLAPKIVMAEPGRRARPN